MRQSDGGPFLTVVEVATYLRVSARTVQRMIKRGDLQAFTVGGLRRIPMGSIERMLKGDDPVTDPDDYSPFSLF